MESPCVPEQDGKGQASVWGRSERSVVTFPVDYGTLGPQSHFGRGRSRANNRTFPTPPSK